MLRQQGDCARLPFAKVAYSMIAALLLLYYMFERLGVGGKYVE